MCLFTVKAVYCYSQLDSLRCIIPFQEQYIRSAIAAGDIDANSSLAKSILQREKSICQEELKKNYRVKRLSKLNAKENNIILSDLCNSAHTILVFGRIAKMTSFRLNTDEVC